MSAPGLIVFMNDMSIEGAYHHALAHQIVTLLANRPGLFCSALSQAFDELKIKDRKIVIDLLKAEIAESEVK
jgi:hypothetical protein